MKRISSHTVELTDEELWANDLMGLYLAEGLTVADAARRACQHCPDLSTDFEDWLAS